MLAQGGLQEGFGDLALQDFMFRLAEREGLDRIGHLAEVLYHSARAFGEWLASAAVRPFIASVVDEHLNRLGVPHRIEPGRLAVINRIAYDYPGTPAVSLLLPVGDSLSALQRSVESFLENTDYPSYELLLVASGPLAPDMAAWLEAVQDWGASRSGCSARRLRAWPGASTSAWPRPEANSSCRWGRGSWPFVRTGCASCSTTAAARRSGRSAASSWAWTERFARRAWCLAWAARRAARSPARRRQRRLHRLLVVQNHTALSASCLLFKRSLHDELGGFDENDFAHGHADVDFSLRARQLGYLSVWTPYAILAQNGNVELPSVEADESLYRRWLPALARDPAYNRNLSLEGPGSPWSAPRYRPGNRCSDGRRCRGSWRILPIPTVVATIACVSRSARCTTPACWTACSASRSCSRWRWSAWRSTA